MLQGFVFLLANIHPVAAQPRDVVNGSREEFSYAEQKSFVKKSADIPCTEKNPPRIKKTEAPAPLACSFEYTVDYPSMWMALRHIEPGGVGYNKGYTTLEAFFTKKEPSTGSYLPFFNLLGHLFDDGKRAANVGLGLRYLGSERIFGVNGYYDYRKTSARDYNQISIGFETVGEKWDARINGYLPVGKKSAILSSNLFSYFQDHYLYLSAKKEFSLGGVNGEVGCYLNSYGNFPVYFAVGPYYLTGEGKKAVGGQLRAAIDLREYIRVEGNCSYDTLFNWIGQGQISLIIPFGKKRTFYSKREEACCVAQVLDLRARQSVARNEIIPIDIQTSQQVAINPATGSPWFFWFVDNTSHSAGSFESPFPTLLEAQVASMPNQVIYVYPGDGTSTGMDQGITLQDQQLLFGASVSHPLLTTDGLVSIPSMASSLPQLTNGSDTGNVVTLANGNTVSGFSLLTSLQSSGGISGEGITNFNGSDNSFSTVDGLTTNGIYLFDVLGTISIDQSQFSGFSNLTGGGNGNGILIGSSTPNPLTLFQVTNSTFTGISDISGGFGGTGISILDDTLVTTFHAIGNIFNQFTAQGVGIYFLGTPQTSIIANNAFNDFTDSDGILNTGSGIVLNVRGNRFTNFNSSTGIRYAGEGVSTTLNVKANIFDQFDDSAGLNIDSNISYVNVANNRFLDVLTNSKALVFNHSTPSNGTELKVLTNTFSGDASILGWSANISTTDGGLCLQFLHNSATPTGSPNNPYNFSAEGGTFNRTLGSDATQNIGDFTVGVGVGDPGSCSQ